MHPDGLGLDTSWSLKLALCWLRGGDIFDYLALDVSEDVLTAMILQAALENSVFDRIRATSKARLLGYKQGLDEGMEITRIAA
jgi:hypothetical protein